MFSAVSGDGPARDGAFEIRCEFASSCVLNRPDPSLKGHPPVFTPDVLPEPLAQVLTQVRHWSGDDARAALAAAGADERARWLAGLQQLADAVTAAALTAVEVFDAHGDGQALHGASSTAAWLRGAVRVTGPEAAERVRIARGTRTVLAGPVERLGRGELTYDHLRAIERGTRHLPADQQVAGAHVLTDLARIAPVADVRAAAAHLQYVLDPDGSLVDTQRQFDRRHLTMAPLMDGMTSLSGLLDPESAALLTSALGPFLVPADADDARTTAQRRADGLVQIVQAACDHSLLPTSGGQRPQLNIVLDPRTGTPTEASVLTSETTPSVLPPGQLVGAAGSPRFLHPLSVARVACDAHLTALILNEDGVVVDLGRTQRLFSSAQRRLLALRDGGCRFPACDRPAAHTDAHHVVPWHAGGTTDVPNAVLLCRHHHRAVHEGDWQIDPADGQQGTNSAITFRHPNGSRYVSHPRGP